MSRWLLILTLFAGPGFAKFLNGACDDSTCAPTGECIPVISGGIKHWCKCSEGYSGWHCEMPPCPEEFCQNGGQCVKPLFGTVDDYQCECSLGFEGRFCENEVESVCSLEPCEHGTCFLTSSINEYVCECENGFRGVNCTEKEPCPPGHCGSGTCTPAVNEDGFICSCPHNFQGERCNMDVNECLQSPCENGGICKNSFGDYSCRCPRGFLGERCQHNITALFSKRKECSIGGDDACLNGGVCRETEGFRTCACPPMFEGHRCEKDVDECDRLSPCQNGGICTNFDGGFECSCPYGFHGERCETVEDFCTPNPCRSGVCVSNDQATCLCPPGKTGQFCDQDDYCVLAEPCKNGAECNTDSTTGDYSCLCKEGFKGDKCEEDVDECSIGTGFCYNNGSCRNTNGGYTCDCPKPFAGVFCDEVMTACRPNPCGHGMCLDRIDSFECVCPSGYSGLRCEILPPLICSAGDCENGGSCHQGQCACPKGFTGLFCQETIVAGTTPGRCLSNPCHHGICQEEGGEDGYRCHCLPGFAGRNCEMDIDECGPGLCHNYGDCVDLENDYTCSCKKGFTGKHCEERVDWASFNETNTLDGGCPSASYCAKVFRNGACDEICDNEACLYDGFDCAASSTKCPQAEYCQRNYSNGFCDALCNSSSCGFDGGDCGSPAKEETLTGEIVLALLTSPSSFRQRLNVFLMTLSGTLRSSVKIRSDAEGPMVFEWKDGQTGQRVPLDKEQPLSVHFAGTLRGRRSVTEEGVIVWLSIDTSTCRRDCFSDIATVVDFLGRAEAKRELEDLGIPIKEARIDRREPSESSSSALGMVILIIGVCILVGAVGIVSNGRERTRKRRIVTAPTWFPPTDESYKAIQKQIDDLHRDPSLISLYGTGGDVYSSIKRLRPNDPMIPSFSGFTGNHPLPLLPFQNQVFAKAPGPRSFPDYSDLHDKAASFEAIPLPINAALVNERNGPSGVTPLILVARNRDKLLKHILEDVENLYKAGANLDAQDEDEQTALFIATRLGRLELAKRLLELGADATKMDKMDSTPLHQAAHNGDLLMVRELLQHEAVKREVDEMDKWGRTALMCSAFNDSLSTDVAATLLEAGADPSYQGDKSVLGYRGRSAMHYAAQYDNSLMLRFLVEKGADKDAQDLEECTPLILAVRASCVRSVQVLVDAGADPFLADQTGTTPKMIAEENNDVEIAGILNEAQTTYAKVARLMPMKPKIRKQSHKRQREQLLTPPHSEGATTPPSAGPMLYSPNSPPSDGRSTTTSPIYINQNPYDSPEWTMILPPPPVPCHQQTFTSDYDSAGSSFEASSYYPDNSNTSDPIWN